ncbi:MAG: Holliday junction branch migration DNA helicase RuvB, partial [Erysipelotrichaceae bacterium]|nr:Holliday junction branch migration DNA helicase RuvB [Erysipelotrichaceae bacterium]
IFGPPGLGKTTLAHILANEKAARSRSISAPAIEKIADLAMILTSLEAGDILFIDEIHRLSRVIEESLYSAMEDFKLSIVVGKSFDEGGRAIEIDLPPFTLIGATTRVGDISSPLRSRFGIVEKLNYYDESELTEIVKRSSNVFNIVVQETAALEIARRSRGTPRIANRILRRVRDFASFYDATTIDLSHALDALMALRIDANGLDEIDIKYLTALHERFNDAPVGVESLAVAISEEVSNLEDVYEPYLILIGFINRTSRGRQITSSGISYLKSRK